MLIDARMTMTGCVRPLADYRKVVDPQYANVLLCTGLHLASEAEAISLIEAFIDHALQTTRMAVRFRHRVSGLLTST